MSLPRVQLFEWNDLSWAPAPLRDTIVEALSRTLRWGGTLRELVDPFRSFLAATGATEVLDLCAGAAGPAQILVDEILRAGGTPPRFVITDLHPRLEAWEAARARHPRFLDYARSSVDATRIPPELGRGRARVIINAFHHFPPALAQAILGDAVRGAAGVFLAEPFDRNPLRFAALFPAGVLALAATPLLSRRARLAKALLTWATPIAVAASLWDGVVSTLRVYSEAELRAMVAPFGDAFSWHYGHYTYPVLGRGYWFYGVPKKGS